MISVEIKWLSLPCLAIPRECETPRRVQSDLGEKEIFLRGSLYGQVSPFVLQPSRAPCPGLTQLASSWCPTLVLLSRSQSQLPNGPRSLGQLHPDSNAQ